MRVKRLSAALIAAAMLSGAGGLAFAQQPSAKPAPQMPGGDQRSMDHGGMMGDGMMGGMMGGGQRAMDHRGMMGRMMMVPQMPPGNEKLQFQMQAEMMQKMGEVAAKYAERIKEEPRSAPR